ncbi:MAG: ATP-binding cassette domain-containing protein [Roseomonas sp.]|nr:ATP-binding cassette domain-containing protein [Roseomonas sp.]
MRAPDSILPLTAEGLGFSVGGVEILRDISLKITAGAPTLLIGANGAGKSVLLRLLHGLLKPSAGRVFWSSPPEHAARRQAMVFQRPVLLRRSVLANALYPMALAGVAQGEREARAAEALALVGLADRASDPARKLSVGQQQRLALARAAALQPELLFLDEPSASLDPAATRAVEEIVLKLAARGTKIVMTTHDLAQARRLAGDIIFLHRGSVLEKAPAAAFFQRPASATARAFLRGELVW